MKHNQHGVQGGKVAPYMPDAAFIVHPEQSLARNANIVRAEQPTFGHGHHQEAPAASGRGRGKTPRAKPWRSGMTTGKLSTQRVIKPKATASHTRSSCVSVGLQPELMS